LSQKVVPTPEISSVSLSAQDVVLVCCDGLVERLTNERIANHVLEKLREQKEKAVHASPTEGDTNAAAEADLDPALICASLLDYALSSGSKDNMSALLYLPAPPSGEGYARADEYVLGPYSEWSSERSFSEAYFTDALKHGLDAQALQVRINEYNQRRRERGEGIGGQQQMQSPQGTNTADAKSIHVP
jgi:hypothetical protein